MLPILVQLLPVFVYFGIGVLLKHAALAEAGHGEFLLRFVFFVTLPALILTSLPQTALNLDKAMLPLANVAVSLACMAATLGAARLLRLQRGTEGAMLVSTMILNNSYMFPFILAVYGQAGFSDAILFDFGNALLMATFVYALAFRYGGAAHGRWTMLLKILKSPLVWALVVSVALSLTGTPLPEALQRIAAPLGAMTAPLILIALGIFFSFRTADLRLVSLTLFIRMGLGLLFGMGAATLLGLQGLSFVVVSLCAAGPVGFNALTFSSLARLDTALSSSAVSLSILIGLIWVPFLIVLFGVR